MASKPRISTPMASTQRLSRKSLANSGQRFHKPQDCHRRACGAASISDKLEVLKSLIPSDTAGVKPDQLYQETADYIMLLKTQVFVLQKLIDFYGSQSQENLKNATQ